MRTYDQGPMRPQGSVPVAPQKCHSVPLQSGIWLSLSRRVPNGTVPWSPVDPHETPKPIPKCCLPGQSDRSVRYRGQGEALEACERAFPSATLGWGRDGGKRSRRSSLLALTSVLPACQVPSPLVPARHTADRFVSGDGEPGPTPYPLVTCGPTVHGHKIAPRDRRELDPCPLPRALVTGSSDEGALRHRSMTLAERNPLGELRARDSRHSPPSHLRGGHEVIALAEMGVEPFPHMVTGLLRRAWLAEHPGVGEERDETGRHDPGDAT